MSLYQRFSRGLSRAPFSGSLWTSLNSFFETIPSSSVDDLLGSFLKAFRAVLYAFLGGLLNVPSCTFLDAVLFSVPFPVPF